MSAPVVHDYNVGRQYFELLNLDNAKASLPFKVSSGDRLLIREKTRDDITGIFTGRERRAEISEAVQDGGRTACRLKEIVAVASNLAGMHAPAVALLRAILRFNDAQTPLVYYRGELIRCVPGCNLDNVDALVAELVAQRLVLRDDDEPLQVWISLPTT